MPKNGHHKMDKERTMKHIVQQPFIVATSIAALIHSTWSLGTLFSGTQPEGWHLVGWLIPALLIAFAIDVGQIATSAEIREHGLTPIRGLTFVVFAMATYYLQWLYMAHHMPILELSLGISESMVMVATQLRDMAIWFIPALLPVSTLLYTFSAEKRALRAPETTSKPEPKYADDAVIYELPETPLLLIENIDPIEAYKQHYFLSKQGAEVSVQDEPKNTLPTPRSKKRTVKDYEDN
jgi:flagellar biosynthesis protein FliQ